MDRSIQKHLILFATACVLFSSGKQVLGISRWTAGNENYPWGETGSFVSLDDTTDAGWLQPIFVSAQNLSLGARERGGRIVSDLFRGTNLLTGLINGDHTVAFPDLSDRSVARRMNSSNLEVTLILDLGAAFGADSISFYPRQGFKQAFMRGYQVWVNDGSEEIVLPQVNFYSLVKDWHLVAKEFPTKKPFARIKFPLQFVRYVAISDTISLPDPVLWEIDEIEIWGNGYAALAQFESEVIDLGDRANFGNIIWSAVSDSGSSVVIRTRSGQTPDPFLYYRLTGLGLTGEEEVAREQYEKLRPSEEGSILPDTENWSAWSAPYPSTGEEPFISQGPARYFQFKIDFYTFSPLARTKLDSFSVEFSAPVLGKDFIAELSSQEVVPGKPTTFNYAVRAVLEPQDTGFDGLEVSTPLEAEIREVRINRERIEFFEEVGQESFRVWFPEDRITTHGTLLEVTFDCRVLVYGTRFTGKVFDTTREGDISQVVRPGDATKDIESNDLLVTWPLDRSLLAAVETSQAYLTPNGDGVNDAVKILFSLLQVTDPIHLSVEIYDLAGRRVWRDYRDLANGRHWVAWTGIDESGHLVPPGLYIYRVLAEADTGDYERMGTIGVVY